MLKLSMFRSESRRRLASLPGYLLAGVFLGAVLSSGPAAFARQQDTGFLNRSITLNGIDYHYVVYLPMEWTPKQKWPVILFLHAGRLTQCAAFS
jgi:hypothetical protein